MQNLPTMFCGSLSTKQVARQGVVSHRPAISPGAIGENRVFDWLIKLALFSGVFICIALAQATLLRIERAIHPVAPVMAADP